MIGPTDLLSEVSKFPHHTKLSSKCGTRYVSADCALDM